MFSFLFISFLIESSGSQLWRLCSAASDLGLYCLPRFRFRDARLEWIKPPVYRIFTAIVTYIVEFVCTEMKLDEFENTQRQEKKYTIFSFE